MIHRLVRPDAAVITVGPVKMEAVVVNPLPALWYQPISTCRRPLLPNGLYPLPTPFKELRWFVPTSRPAVVFSHIRTATNVPTLCYALPGVTLPS